MENSASRTRSEVGRVASPGGACSRRPPYLPAITRIQGAQADRNGERRLGEDRRHRRRERPPTGAAPDVAPPHDRQRRTGRRSETVPDLGVRTRSPVLTSVEGRLRGYVAGEGALRDVWVMGRLRPALERADD
jgi:hypothetical protein